MNYKKGLIKFSAAITIIFLLLVLIIIFTDNSFAVTPESSYDLGDKIKFDFREKQDYSLKIVAPSNTFIKRGDRDVFVYKPEEIGEYALILEYENKTEHYKFVIGGLLNSSGNIQENFDEIKGVKEFGYELNETDIDSDDLEENPLNEDLIDKIPANVEHFYLSKEVTIFINYSASEKIDIMSPEAKTFPRKIKNSILRNRATAKLYDINGNLANLRINAEKLEDGMKLDIFDAREIKPGLNKLEISVVENGEETLIEKWFTWGVLTLNFDKSIYMPEENAFIGIAVLDDSGSVECEADVTLSIKSPSGVERLLSTKKGDIIISNECHILGVTNLPDYYVNYRVSELGFYEVNLTAETTDGIRSVVDGFEVRENVEFDVKRIGPTRTFPIPDYSMRFIIKANQNYSGETVEKVPLSFEIKTGPEFEIKKERYLQEIIWDVEFVKGQEYELFYEFNVPDVSPMLYTLGPLKIGDFEELRQWNIANDADVTIESLLLDATNEHGTGSSVVFVNDTIGYAFFINDTGRVSYKKTLDSGASWGNPVPLTSQTDTFTVSVWYDRWTPGDSGRVIHISYGDTGSDTYWYDYLNTTDDTQRSSEVSISGDVGRIRPEAQMPSVVKSRAGNLFVSGGGDNVGNTRNVWKSTNNGTSWASSSATFNNDGNDEYQLLPLIDSAGHIIAIYLDASANTLFSRIYNETNDTWMGAGTIATSFSEGGALTSTNSWGATLNNNTGYIFLVGNNNPETAGGDLVSFEYDKTSWVLRGDVYTNIGTDGRGVKVSIDQTTGDLYSTYVRGNGGSFASANVYYKLSTNNMTSWSDEVQLSSVSDNLVHPRPDLMNTQRLYAAWYNNDLNDMVGATLKDIGTSGDEIESLNSKIFSTDSVTSISVSPLTYDRFVLGWCDDGLNKIKAAVYNTSTTTGIATTIDATSGSCNPGIAGHSVGMAGLDQDRFVIAWYDSVDADTTFKVFYSNLTNITGDIDVDTDTGTSGAVSVTALNSTAFALAWYDQATSDMSFMVYSSSGTALTSEIDIDTDALNDAYSIDISAVNETAVVLGWFDSNGNDATVVMYSTQGTALSTPYDVDGGAGESRSVSVAVLNETAFVLAWHDQNTNDASFRILKLNNALLTGEIDVDADVGSGRSVTVASLTHDDLIFAWYDAQTDLGISARAYLGNGTPSSSENVVQSNSNRYQEVISEERSTGLQLCENAYVIALTNTTSNAYWAGFYPNGTAWNGSCPTYVPQISEVNATGITITNATIVWNTNVEANSTVNYGKTLVLGNFTGNNIPVLNHSVTLGGLSGSATYYFNVTSCIDGRCNSTGVFNFTTDESDTQPPAVSLFSPNNNSNITSGFGFNFVYNVTDLSIVNNCSIYVDGILSQNSFGIQKNVNQTFYQHMSNGTHQWYVSCTDEFGNIGFSNENRTVNVQVSNTNFQERFWETYESSFSADNTAVIWLNNTRDTTQNSVTWNVLPLTLVNVVNASTRFIGSNGALIPSGTTITFSASFSTAHGNLRGTWKLFVSNSTGNTLLCQNGDDGSAGTQLPGAGGGTISSANSTCVSSGFRLQPSDRLSMTMNVYNTNTGTTRTLTHVWDGSTSSYVDVNVTTEGFLSTNLTYPTSPISISTGEIFNATCQVSCDIGFCRNTQLYVQYNTSTTNWVNVSGSGNIILASGQSNPVFMGNVSTTSVSTNFSLQGNADSVNNIRCFARSSYDSDVSPRTEQITVGTADTAPTVSLTNPASNTFQNNSQIVLYYNVSDANNNLANSTLILNGQRNMTNQSALLNGQINNFTITLSDGVYNWSINASDLTNLEGNSSIRNFTIDTSAPNITLYNPLQNESVEQNNVLFNFSVSDNLDTLLVCDLVVDSIVRQNDFNVTNGSFVNYTETLSTGLHWWNVTCLDNANSLGISGTRNFTVTEAPPSVELITSNNTYSTSSNLTLIYNATDNNGFSESKLIINGQVNQTNQTAVLNGEYSNFSVLNLLEGTYLWTVNVTDTAGLNATASARTFIVDLNNPNVTLNLPSNNTVSNSSIVNFNFTVTDAIDTSLVCNLTVGQKSNLNFAAANGSLTNRQITGLTDGNKLWNVTCADDSGRSGISENWFVNITERPAIQLNTANNTFFNSSIFNLTYTPSDNTNLSVCSLYIDVTFNQTNSSAVINGRQNNFSVSGESSGQHTWYVTCNDTINLQNQSEIRTFTVDTDGLNVGLLYPFNGSELFTNTIEFSYNVTDDIDPYLSCDVNVNSVVVDSFNATNGAITNRSVLFADGGFKLWNVTCTDDAFNTVTSETRNFTLALAPELSLSAPANNSFLNYSNISFSYYVIDDNNNLANATLIINGQRNITNQSEVLNDATNYFYINLTDGFYNWTVNVTDLTNLESTSSEFLLTVDTAPPFISLNYPGNETLFTTNNITLNFTAIDNIDANISCTLNIDENPEASFYLENGTAFVTYRTKNDGIYLWNVNCIDDAQNNNVSETRMFIVEAPPIVTNLDPINKEILNLSTIDFVYLPEDTIGIFNCSLYIDDISNSTTETVTANQNNSFSVLGIPEGYHDWNVQCTDVFPDFNLGISNSTNFTVDRTPPLIALNDPLNNSNTLRTIEFNFTAIDVFDSLLSCNLYIDGALNVSSINAVNNSETVQSVSGLSLGQHNWRVSCADDVFNINQSVIFDFNVTYPDLYIDAGNITFNNTSPSENDTVLISANIYNLINVTVRNINVSFFEGDPDSGGVQIGGNQTIAQISGLNNLTVSVEWYASLGTSDIFVHVDPPISSNGTIVEWNELNNEANNSVSVGSWQFVYGDISEKSVFQLADQENQSVVVWNASNFEDGGVFVADKESSILWNSLYAIGRNILGVNTSNDFSDMDSLLNMNSFADSIANVFTNGTVPLSTESLVIFNNLIEEIPMANSTNNTNFLTGILWDGSDDTGDSQFSQGDSEDLIFMTQVKKDLLGAYGVYDYEIRIPARLREYLGPDLKTVIFYVEIK